MSRHISTNKTARKLTIKDGQFQGVVITLTEVGVHAINYLVETGLYGSTPAQVCRRFVEAEVTREVVASAVHGQRFQEYLEKNR